MWLQQPLIVRKSDKTNSTPNFTEEERTSEVILSLIQVIIGVGQIRNNMYTCACGVLEV